MTITSIFDILVEADKIIRACECRFELNWLEGFFFDADYCEMGVPYDGAYDFLEILPEDLGELDGNQFLDALAKWVDGSCVGEHFEDEDESFFEIRKPTDETAYTRIRVGVRAWTFRYELPDGIYTELKAGGFRTPTGEIISVEEFDKLPGKRKYAFGGMKPYQLSLG